MDAKDIKLKVASKLTDEDKKFISENPDKFTDEDRSAWSEVLTPDTSEEPVTPAAEPAVTPEPDPNAEPAATPAAPADPNAGGLYFKTEEEAKAFVQKTLADEKQAAIDAAKTPEEKKYVEDNWRPKNWQEGIKTAAEAAADIIEARQAERAKQVEAHNKKVEEDWQSLRKEAKLKDVDDAEGLKVHDAIIEVGKKYGKKNFKDAYEVYKTIPVEFGGGYTPKVATPPAGDPPADPTPTPAPAVTPSEAAAILAKSKSDAAKKAASKVGGQNPGTQAAKGSGVLKPITYEEMKSKSPSKLYKEALAS